MTNFQTKTNKTILIVGLGNPGKEHSNARHNVGFMVIDAFVNELRITRLRAAREQANYELRKKFNSDIVEIKNDPQLAECTHIILAKPQTYMNNSGAAVSALAKFYTIQPTDIWVVCDDFYLPAGKLRIRELGSSGGHNGAQSIIDHIGATVFPRFRIGIGPLPKTSDPAVFVLKPFLKTELVKIHTALQEAIEALRYALDCGIPKAMSHFNSL